MTETFKPSEILKPRKYQFNVMYYDENGMKRVEWDAQDPIMSKKDLIESGINPEDIHIIENFGQAHYEHDGKFYDGYRYGEDGNLYWEYDNDDA